MDDGKPKIRMFGESDGSKKGISIIGNGCNLYQGGFDVEMHGVELKGVGILNGDGS